MQTSVNISYTIEKDVIIFEFSGELDETNTDKIFSDIHRKIAISGKNHVIFNFEALKYLNSKAIWYVADTFSVIQDKNGRFVIYWMNDAVTMVADIVGLESIVQICATRSEALATISRL